jgi:hypothetical protein
VSGPGLWQGVAGPEGWGCGPGGCCCGCVGNVRGGRWAGGWVVRYIRQ